MTTNQEQLEALRLAYKYAEHYNGFRMRPTHETEHDLEVFRSALESELRRQHEEIESLKAERDGLVDALKSGMGWWMRS